MASGEVSAASLVAQPVRTDLIVLNSFKDNLACESGLRTVRDPALASLPSGWTGKLLITCGTAFSLPPGDRDRFVFPGVLAARPAHIAECEAAGLLTPRAGRELTVHRWTAGQLHHRLAEADRTAQLAAAHRQAGGYWHARTATPQLGPRAQLEAAYHLHGRRASHAGPRHDRRQFGADSAQSWP